jgi:hypothetical protein
VSAEVRASDADRDRVLDVLRAAAADGRLTADELDERVGAALTSRTLGELAGLTADLAAPPVPPQAKDVVKIDQRGGSVQLAGRWAVPRRLELRPSWCDVTLDFTEAVITHDTLVIDMSMRGGSLTVMARAGILVDIDDLKVRYTDVEIGPIDDPDASAVLTVHLTGRMRYGRIEARWPGRAPGR